MKSFLAVLICGIALFLLGCSLEEKYARNNQAAESWLALNPPSRGKNIEGSWKPVDADWGTVRLVQKGSDVSGFVGDYSVDGHVRGENVYLTLKSEGWVYYSVIMKVTQSRMKGFYSSSVPFSTKDQASIEFKRVFK